MATRILPGTRLSFLKHLISTIACLAISGCYVHTFNGYSQIENGIAQAYLIEQSENGLFEALTPVGLETPVKQDGTFNIGLPPELDSRKIIIRVTAGPEGTMTCIVKSGCERSGSEQSHQNSLTAFGQKIPLESDFYLTAALPELAQDTGNPVNISILSHLAVTKARTYPGGLSEQNIDQAYHDIENLFGLSSGSLKKAAVEVDSKGELTISQEAASSPESLQAIQKSLHGSLLSAAFLTLTNEADWHTIEQVVRHAVTRIASSGTLTRVNHGSLPDVSLADTQSAAAQLAGDLLSMNSDQTAKTLIESVQVLAHQEYDALLGQPTAGDSITIIQQPYPQKRQESETAQFSVRVIGGQGLHYQWHKDASAISGANEPRLVIENTTPGDSGDYFAVISSAYGSVVSSTASLTVEPSPIAEPPVAPPLEEPSPPVPTDPVVAEPPPISPPTDMPPVAQPGTDNPSLPTVEPFEPAPALPPPSDQPSNAVQLADFEIQWDIPNRREDGSPLHVSEIQGYTLAIGRRPGQLNEQVFVPSGLSQRYILEDLEPGTYYFAIATIDLQDHQSPFSSQRMVIVF